MGVPIRNDRRGVEAPTRRRETPESGIERIARSFVGLGRGESKKASPGLKNCLGGPESDLVQSAHEGFQSAKDGVRLERVGVRLEKAGGGLKKLGGGLEKAGGGPKKLGVESDEAGFQSGENSVRVDEVRGGLKKVGVRLKKVGGGLKQVDFESDASRFQSAQVGGGLKHADVGLDELGGRLEKAGGGLNKVGVESTEVGFESTEAGFLSTEVGFQSAEAGFQSNALRDRRELRADRRAGNGSALRDVASARMLDVARVVVLLVALVKAVRHRFVLGAACAALAAMAMALVAVAAYSALSRHDVDGEYAFAFVYVGPTMLPLGNRSWLPLLLQLVLTAITAVPAVAVLRTPSSPVTSPFLLVFVPNAMLAVLTGFAAFLMWRQESILPGYWDNPSLVGNGLDRRYSRLALRPGWEEGTLASSASQTPVTLLVRNYSDVEIHLMWIDPNGHRDSRPDALDRWRRDGAAPGITIEKSTFAGQAFVITDNEAEAMCTFVSGTEDAVADVAGPCR